MKTTSFTHRPRVSLARFSFCWWRHNRLLTMSQWPETIAMRSHDWYISILFTAIFTAGHVRNKLYTCVCVCACMILLDYCCTVRNQMRLPTTTNNTSLVKYDRLGEFGINNIWYQSIDSDYHSISTKEDTSWNNQGTFPLARSGCGTDRDGGRWRLPPAVVRFHYGGSLAGVSRIRRGSSSTE